MNAWTHFAACHQGGRPYQEDHFGVYGRLPDELLLVLADGMGGERAGDRASALAVQSFIDAYAMAAEPVIAQRLRQALEHANQTLALAVAADVRSLAGMGCTLLAVVLAKEGLSWVSVGDSPLWLWRRGELIRLNDDHSYRQVLARQVAAGEISSFEADHHPDRYALMSALTGAHPTLVDLCEEPFSLEEGDRVLLASDGLLTLSEAQIRTCLEGNATAKPACRHLLDAVIAAGHPYQDNVTVMLAQAAGGGRSARRGLIVALVLAMLALGAGGLWWRNQGDAAGTGSAASIPVAADSGRRLAR